MKKFDKDRALLGLAAPVLAVLGGLIVTGLVLLASGKEPFHAFHLMLTYGSKSDSQVYILNKATPYYLSGLAVAIGFRMNLFNIGVDGQYRLAAFFAAAVGGSMSIPGAIQIPVVILTAMAVGAAWAAIAGVLKVTRGVSEVISTIMLNSLAGIVIGYFLQDGRLGVTDKLALTTSTKPLPSGSHLFNFTTQTDPVDGFIVFAGLAGLVYWFVLSRTRFGFDLRSVGRSESAAQAGGVSVKKMVVVSMLLSGAMAGLVGMSTLLNESYKYSTEFPAGIGFTGIAVALLGRNNPIGIAVGALLWAFLERASNGLEFEGYDKEIVGVIQGAIVLAVVIAYEVVRRYRVVAEQREVAEQVEAHTAVEGAQA
jgi:simple sugar transport system permease protein